MQKLCSNMLFPNNEKCKKKIDFFAAGIPEHPLKINLTPHVRMQLNSNFSDRSSSTIQQCLLRCNLLQIHFPRSVSPRAYLTTKQSRRIFIFRQNEGKKKAKLSPRNYALCATMPRLESTVKQVDCDIASNAAGHLRASCLC